MKFLRSSIPYLLMLPAILIGAIAMISNDVPSSIWLQNIVVWLVGTTVGLIYIVRYKKKKLNEVNLFSSIIIVLLLVLPFLFNGIEGVHRWLTIGPINIYIASIILPLFIIQIWRLVLNNHVRYAMKLIFITLFVLLFQPDAGQLTAFAFATVIILWIMISNWKIKYLSILLTVVFVIISWIYLDDLAPVNYVEGIIFLVADLGITWFVLGILSFVLLLVPFFFYGRLNVISIALASYFIMEIIVTLFGNFPVPIMGYGISPIIGYIIAISWVIKNNKKST